MDKVTAAGQTYKLLVVDDEDYALEGIMRTIDWTSLGIMDVYGADCVENAKIIMKHGFTDRRKSRGIGEPYKSLMENRFLKRFARAQGNTR